MDYIWIIYELNMDYIMIYGICVVGGIPTPLKNMS